VILCMSVSILSPVVRVISLCAAVTLIVLSHLFLFTMRRPRRSTLFPYTTLFRSREDAAAHRRRGPEGALHRPHRRGHRERRPPRSEEHTSELQSLTNLVCRLLLEKKKRTQGTLSPSQTHTAPMW